ncbi:MAG: hypothetical protein MSH25_07515 [Desulfovibrio sp.]|uniref:hypothetical protein n=1 Tax=Desulfovibrio sp. TaxID=885 RepID=UPI0025BB0697|nr:hypothetical protein [Desulfovibrio sp.]MCI7569191.1 hypothetical protein [Desulfovibrio sp.]
MGIASKVLLALSGLFHCAFSSLSLVLLPFLIRSLSVRRLATTRLRDGDSGLSALPCERRVHSLGEKILKANRCSEQRPVKVAGTFFRDHPTIEGSDLRISAVHKDIEAQLRVILALSHNNPFSLTLFCKKSPSDSQEGYAKAEKGADFCNQPPCIICFLLLCYVTRKQKGFLPPQEKTQ